MAEKVDSNSNPKGEGKASPQSTVPQPLKTEKRSLIGQKQLQVLTAKISDLSKKVGAFRESHLFEKAVSLSQHPKFWLFFGMGVGVSSSALLLGWSVYRLESSITESVADISTYMPPGTIRIKGADGTVLQEIGPVTHEKLKIWQIPQPVLEAFIASEDRRFRDHRGVDFQGILRAAFSNLQAGGVVEGGSTITQQLARIVFLNQERSLARKIKEMRLAQKIEQHFTKEQILERYLNLVYLGSGAYGLGDAAWVYFGKTVDKLTIPEAATLAAIVPAPSVYSPIENQAVAKERRDIVLRLMQEQGFITLQEVETAIASPLTINPQQPKRLERKAPYFTDYVQRELPKYISPEVIKAGGITVETTLNAGWQEVAEKTIERGVRSYGRWQRFQQAALVSIDPRNGQIKALVGGNDFDKNQYDRVTQAKRQPGSTFKPFVYATAIASGMSPYRSFVDGEYVVDGYKPENFGDKYSGKSLTLVSAIASSVNVVAVQVLVKIGWNPIIQLAHKMGIESTLYPTYSLALGASEVTLLELTSAYGSFANRGVHQDVYAISRIRDRQGNVLYQATPKSEAALDSDSVAIMTWLLRGVVTSGTGQPAQIGRPVAGKTGTSDKARDLWFVGYIPQLVTGIWLGNDDNTPTQGASTTAAVLWGRFMGQAVEGMAIESFPSLPNLGGRKATIKAEPITPRKVRLTVPKVEEPDSQQLRNSDEPTRTRRRSTRRRVTYRQAEQPAISSHRRQISPAASASQAAPLQAESNPAPVAESAPVIDTAPLAPPAARKE